MGETTAISWAKRTWNPWRGCEKVSPGCAHCYMFEAQTRYGRNPSEIVRTKTWGDPIRWEREAKQSSRVDLVFTCSWSDFFHPLADAWRDEAWQIIGDTPNLTYQILTKRVENIPDRLPPDWGSGYSNVWLGTSIENRHFCRRRDRLISVPAAVHFISAEPLLEDIADSLNLEHIEWLIVGGESGPGYRPMRTEWAKNLLQKSRRSGTAFFFKQSAAPRTEMGTTLDGLTYHEFPQA
jgi:protein gp37